MQRVLPPELARYSHELNPEGTACADDCPICQWVDEQEKKEKSLDHGA